VKSQKLVNVLKSKCREKPLEAVVTSDSSLLSTNVN